MEPIKVFLDTNIVLDYYTGRMGDGLAEKIIQTGEHREYQLCISVLTGHNALYVLRNFSRAVGASTLSGQFTILPMDAEQWEQASLTELEDYEDAFQLACARSNECKVLITRDKHLLEAESGTLEALSPEEFISRIRL